MLHEPTRIDVDDALTVADLKLFPANAFKNTCTAANATKAALP
jgi:hypothetical protein